ncbi:MAG TPA: MerR family transcriptional regulator [Caulobacteraceae bacterium]|nr:MerR family transcriptional regulator [Caulobacteraceae bacterium]
MRRYTVKEVAKLSGVSVRTLHHYDEIGLLKPASVADNGYRYYGREELLRLQQILFHRELELPLEAIGKVLGAPDFDRIEALRRHRQTLATRARRYRRLLKTLDETLASLEGAKEMDDKDLYKGFAPEKQEEYEAWLVERGGSETAQRIEQSKSAMKGWTRADFEALREETEAIEAGLAGAMAEGLPADSEPVRRLMRRHQAMIARAWGRPCEVAAFAGLADMYLAHPDFRDRYEGRAAGLTEYLAAAMRAFAS